MAVKIDSRLHEALSSLPPFPFMRLVRQDRTAALSDARAALLAGRVPHFSYSKARTCNIASYQDALANFSERIRELAPNKAVAMLYQAKADELAMRAALVGHMQQADDIGVSQLARALYEAPAATLAELEAHLHEMITHAKPRKTSSQVKHWVDAEIFAEMARRMFAYYGMTDARVRILKRQHVKLGHHRITHAMRLLVPASLRITRRRARQLLAHEIEAHALRHFNGAQSPLHLLARGTAKYLIADEGLAMTLQEAYTQGNRWPGFWESYAVALALAHDGPTTFAKLRDTRTALAAAMLDPEAKKTGEDAAWRLCLRIYRGIAHPDTPGLVFPRDHVYLSGYRAVSVLPDHHALYAGHCSMNNLPLLQELGITPLRTPDNISRKIVRDVIAANRPS